MNTLGLVGLVQWRDWIHHKYNNPQNYHTGQNSTSHSYQSSSRRLSVSNYMILNIIKKRSELVAGHFSKHFSNVAH